MFAVRLTDDAAGDLEDLYSYVVGHDSLEAADNLLQRLEGVVAKLSSSPQRGVYPPELAELGIREFREVFFKPYRIIYRILGRTVFVYLIVDGRRDMRTLLARRLLGA